MRLAKVPGVAETLDWAQALASLHADHLDEELVAETLGCVLKDADDIKRFKRELAHERHQALRGRRGLSDGGRPATSPPPSLPLRPDAARGRAAADTSAS